MKEILFRGKRKDNGEWVEGYPIADKKYSKFYIYTGDYTPSGHFQEPDYLTRYEVDPETIGGYTGNVDMNGVKIFEGDIVKTRKDGTYTKKLKGYYGFDSEGYPQKIPGYNGETEYHYSCQVDHNALVKYSTFNGYYLTGTSRYVGAICNEVIGNIHDNPELLK